MPSVLVLAAFWQLGNAQGMLIDDFERGDFTRTFTGVQGQADGFTSGIDPNHTVGGTRQWRFNWGNNVRGQDINFGNRNGSFETSWPLGGEPNITSTSNLEWGVDQFTPMLLDLSWFTSFEVKRRSMPGFINASNYIVHVRDINHESTNNNRWRQRANEGIGFNRIDFASNPDFDWTRVVYVRFEQRYGFVETQLHGYFIDEIRVVPEPSCLLVALGGLWLAKRRRSTNQS